MYPLMLVGVHRPLGAQYNHPQADGEEVGVGGAFVALTLPRLGFRSPN